MNRKNSGHIEVIEHRNYRILDLEKHWTEQAREASQNETLNDKLIE
jgi:hypothetical protein